MDILQLLGAGPSKATTHDNRLRSLVEEAGKRDENWKRNELAVGAELHECSKTSLHDQIIAEFRVPYVCMHA
jgi:hypothetical protein